MSRTCARCLVGEEAAGSTGRGAHRGGERGRRPRQDHARSTRGASGPRGVPRWPALRRPARGERAAGRSPARCSPGSCVTWAWKATRSRPGTTSGPRSTAPRLTGRRVLILLDNAQDAAQVRSLLPGSSSCAVLVTTRNRTPDLVSTRFVDLNVLEDTEALALFSRIVGEERAAAEPDATAEVLVACAGLPLAIRICAARLAARRQWRIATLAGRLRNEHRRLDELSIGDLAVRASFQVSYGSLKSPVGAGGSRPGSSGSSACGRGRGSARRPRRPWSARRKTTSRDSLETPGRRSTCSSRRPPTGIASTTCCGSTPPSAPRRRNRRRREPRRLAGSSAGT